MTNAERERLTTLLNGHICAFDQNLKALEDQSDLHRVLYWRLLERINEATKGKVETDDERIAAMAFLGWQAMQIEWLRRTLEERP